MTTPAYTGLSAMVKSFATRAEQQFARGYVDCLGWCGAVLPETDSDMAEYPTPDQLPYPYHPSALATFRNDIESFLNYGGDTWDLLQQAVSTGYVTWAQLGHDLWLTRNGHGAGYWDRGLGEIGTKLTEAAKTLGSQDLYVADGHIYVY